MYRKYVLFIVTIALIFAVVSAFTVAQDEQPKAPSLENVGTVAEIMDYRDQVAKKAYDDYRTRLQGLVDPPDNPELVRENQELRQDLMVECQATIGEAEIAAAEKMLAFASNDREKQRSYEILIQGLGRRSMLERRQYRKQIESEDLDLAELREKLIQFEPESMKCLAVLLDELDKSEVFRPIVNDQRFEEFMSRLNRIPDHRLTRAQFEELKKEFKVWMNVKLARGNPTNALKIIIQKAEYSGLIDESNIADKTLKEMVAYINSDECQLSEDEKKSAVMRFTGPLKRMMGASLDLYGRTLDDREFDWKALRGKYVLVEFTATWCGPCKLEIPGMLAAYRQYKDKDFEIVSVYIWQSEFDPVATVKTFVEEEQLPWIIVVEELTEKAGQPKQGQVYNIEGVPTMLLIDKEGKVISTEARGGELQRLLKEMLGG